MHLCFNKTELIAAFKDLIVDTNYRRKGHICSTFVQMNKERDYYEKHSIKYSKITTSIIFLYFK
jgi:hypothetical protein